MLTGQVSLDYMVTVPVYVTITVALATGIKGEGTEGFVTMVDNMKRAITSRHMNYAINHGEGDVGRGRHGGWFWVGG